MTDAPIMSETLRTVQAAIEQAIDCIRGETPEDCTDEEARQDTLTKLREADEIVAALAKQPQADPPQITIADVRKHVGGGMVSSDDVIEAANVLLRERWQPQADGGPTETDAVMVAARLRGLGVKRWREYAELEHKDVLEALRNVWPKPTPPSQAADRMREALEACSSVIEKLRVAFCPNDPLVKLLLKKVDAALSRADDGKKSEGLCPVPPGKNAPVSTETASDEGGSNDSAASRRMLDSESIGSLANVIAATRRENGGSPGPSEPTPPDREAIARLNHLLDVMKSANACGQPMSVWSDDIRAVEDAILALRGGE